MATTKQTKTYDRGYEDAIEGHKEKSTEEDYLKGYRAGLVFVRELDEERVS